MFKMRIVGFLEGLGSECAIALRGAESLTIRRFLGYSLTEQTPVGGGRAFAAGTV